MVVYSVSIGQDSTDGEGSFRITQEKIMSSVNKFLKRIFGKGIRKNESNVRKSTSQGEKPPKIKKEYLEQVIRDTGWSRKKAIETMRSARQNEGITYYNYTRFKLYEMTVKEAADFLKKRKLDQQERKKEKKVQAAADRKAYLSRLEKKTGWSPDYAEEQYMQARERTGCTAEEYFLYRFYELTPEEQNRVFLIRDSRKITQKYNVDKHFVNILYNKEQCNEYFSEDIRRAWCVNKRVSEEQFLDLFRNSRRIFYKPTMGHHGDGAMSCDVTRENIRDLYRTLAEKSYGVVEEYIVQHHRMQELAPAAVNTLRLATISSNTDRPELNGEHLLFLYASQKMGGVDSVVDNLAGGGMVASVDMKTGKLSSDAADDKGNVFSVHPGTGTKIKGFEIPYFHEAVEMVRRIYEKKKIQGYLGWDIAITEDGPEIVEVNTSPGVILFQLPQLTEGHFMKSYMQPYMEETEAER